MEMEIDWDDILPQRHWEHFDTKTWEEYMPPPSRQLSELLPEGWGGSCAIHSLSEVITANLRSSFATKDIHVDLPKLLHLSIAKGFLTARGASLRDINPLIESYGVPLDGAFTQLQGDPRYRLLDQDADVYAVGTSLIPFRGRHMPSNAPTFDVAERCMVYREHLCDALDLSPVVLCYGLQRHYDVARPADQPYRRLPGDDHYIREEIPSLLYGTVAGPVINHCVTAYAYECPGGDVRSLRLRYQENMIGAPGPEPGRHLIHPDAVKYYYFPNTQKVLLSNTPSYGYQSVQYLPQLSLWDSIRSKLFF